MQDFDSYINATKQTINKIDLMKKEQIKYRNTQSDKFSKYNKIVYVVLAILLVVFTFLFNYLFFKNNDPVVYITNTGECYHADGCRYLYSSIPIALSEAKTRYRACSICNPNVTASNNYWAAFFISLAVCIVLLILIKYILNKYEDKQIDDFNLKTDNEILNLIKLIKIPTQEEAKALCNVPDNIVLDKDYNPIGDDFTVYYSSNSSKVYHCSKNCSSAYYKSNIIDVLDKRSCEKCSKNNDVDEWIKKLSILKKQINNIKNILNN